MFTNAYKQNTPKGKSGVKSITEKLDLQEEGVVNEFKQALRLGATVKAQVIYANNSDLKYHLDKAQAETIQPE